MENQRKKKSGCLKFILIAVGIIVILGIIGSLINNSSSEPEGSSSNSKNGTSKSSQNHEELFTEAKGFFAEGKYLAAIETVDQAIKVEENEEYKTFKSEVETAIETRKAELENGFEIKEDKVENITFISPSSGVQQGLVFYPYIGVKDSKKYMLLRVGYQEDATKSLFVFTGVKVRVGDHLEELKFNAMDKMNNVDLFGSGMTELVDISVNKNIEKLLDLIVNSTDDVLVRFEDISNKATDYTLTEDQVQTIVNILEYYGYLAK